MKAFLDPRQALHDPKHFMANGAVLPNPEQPRRIAVLTEAAQAAGCTVAPPPPITAWPRWPLCTRPNT